MAPPREAVVPRPLTFAEAIPIVEAETRAWLDAVTVTEGIVFAEPGDTLTIEARLSRRYGGVKTETLTLEIPDGLEGFFSLVVRGGGTDFFDEFLFDTPENGQPQDEPTSVDDLLRQLRKAPYNNDLIAELGFFLEEGGIESVLQTFRTLDDVVRGERIFDVQVGGEVLLPEGLSPRTRAQGIR